MAGTTVTYGDISLSYILTRSIDRVPEYEGPDYLWTRARLTVQAILSSNVVPTVAGENATQTMNRIKHYMETPRYRLKVEIDGREMLNSPIPGAIKDCKNGPLPVHFNVLRIVGSESFLVEFCVDTWVVDCVGGERPPYQSHRWEDRVTIDKSFISTRTRTGKIVVRGDLDINPDTLRQFAVEGTGAVPAGFIRRKSDWTEDSDGLTLRYTLVDEEQFLMPPPPAADADGEYIESTPFTEGAISFGECWVTLDGSKMGFGAATQEHVEQLIRTAVHICVSMTGYIGDGSNGIILKRAAIKRRLYKPIVHVSMQVQLRPNQARVRIGNANLPVSLSRLTVYPPGSAPQVAQTPDGGTRGSANLLLVAAAMGDPCIRAATVPIQRGENQPIGTDGQQVGQLPMPTWGIIPNDPDDGPGLFILPPTEFFPIHWETKNTYRYDPGYLYIETTEGVEPVRVKQPRLEKEVEFDRQVIGDPPPIPDPNEGDGQRLVDFELEELAPKPADDGNRNEWSIKGSYKQEIISDSLEALGLQKYAPYHNGWTKEKELDYRNRTGEWKRSWEELFGENDLEPGEAK